MKVWGFTARDGYILVRGAITENLNCFQAELFQYSNADENLQHFQLLRRDGYIDKDSPLSVLLILDPRDKDNHIPTFRKLRKTFYVVPSKWVAAIISQREGDV